MREQPISIQVSKLAKEKGFNEATTSYYREDGMLMENFVDEYSTDPNTYYELDEFLERWNDGRVVNSKNETCYGCGRGKYQNVYAAPTQSLLQKWLRETHDIFVSISTTTEPHVYSDDPGDMGYLPIHKYRIIQNINNYKWEVVEDKEGSYDYELVFDNALLEALKLIKITN